MNTSEKLGSKLRMLRELNNFTQEYVATSIEVATNTYSLLEKGQAPLSVERLERLANLYNISLLDLISMADQTFYGSVSNSAVHNVSDAITINNNGVSDEERKLFHDVIERLESQNNKLMALIERLSDKI